MTSTNDGKDVKSNQTSAPKGKSHFIELYKSLESRLSEVSESSERTQHLCTAWSQVHTLCLHSAQSTQSHLLSWLQRHTARTILQTEWQTPKRKEDRARLESAINAFISQCHEASGERDRFPWETQLVARGEWFKKVLDRPWDHPVLNVLLNPNGTPPTDDEVLIWLKEERGVTFVMRLHTLVGEKCEDIAVALAAAVMERVRGSAGVTQDLLLIDETKDKPKPSPVSSFGEKLTAEAGFTPDVWELLTDIEFVLLHKRDSSRCIGLAKQTPLRSAYQLVERLQSRLELSPKEKRLWKNAKDVAVLIAQVVIARCMVVPVCAGVARGALYCCAKSLARALGPRLAPATAALAAPAASAKHLHTLAQAVDAHFAQIKDTTMKPYVCELYVRAITAGMNELERLKLKTEKESEARQMEKTLCQWFMQLGNVLNASDRIMCECTLTAFSVHPTVQMYDKIKESPLLPNIVEQIEPKLESISEFGSWASDSRSQTNFVKTSETLNMKSQQQANVLSNAIFNEGEALGLSPDLCQDIAVLLSGPRVKTLTWDMDREQLIEHCRIYMERTHQGTRALTTELKFLNLNPQEFMHLPEEEDDEDDVYYGIEKGYEHLVPLQDPDDIWDDPHDPERTESAYSATEEKEITVSRRKKKIKPLVMTSEDEADPLSLVAENKRSDKNKERPHSKERSKERKKKEPGEVRVKEPKEKKEKKKKDKHEKEKKERKKKEKVPKTDALAKLVGLKVAKTANQGTNETVAALGNFRSFVSDSDYDSQGKSSMTSINSVESDVLFDGHFSMDELKSPEHPQNVDNIGLMKNNEFSVSNGRVGVHHPLTDQQKLMARELLNQAPLNTVSEDVKRSIYKLIDYRRQRAAMQQTDNSLSPHAFQGSFDGSRDDLNRQNPVKILNNTLQSPESKLYNTSSGPSTPLQSCISPKAVAIPEIPKTIINKNHSEKLAQLKREIDNILATKNKPILSSSIQSPVIQYARKSTEDPGKSFQPNQAKTIVPGPTQHQNPIRMKDLVTVGQERYGPYQTKPVFAQSRPSLPVHRSPITETPGESSYKKFLAEFQKTIDKPQTKRQMKPVSRVTPVIPHVKADSPQRAKPMPQQKKPDNSLNTFSRRSYMYKNKQADVKKASEASKGINTPRTSLGSKIEDFVWDHLHRRSQDQTHSYNSLPKVSNEHAQSVKRSEKTRRPVSNSDNNTILSHILGHTDTKNASTSTCARVTPKPAAKPVTPPKSYLSEQDQADLIKLLRQQSTFNSTPQPVKQQMYNTVAPPPLPSPSGHEKDNTVPTKTPTNKVINVLSSTIIKPPSKTTAAKSKPIISKKVAINEIEQSKKTECKIDTKKSDEISSEFQSVFNALRAQKTPSRGPNALDVALNKSSFEKAFEDSLRKNHNVAIPEKYKDPQLSKSYNTPKVQDNDMKSSANPKNVNSKAKGKSVLKINEQRKHTIVPPDQTKQLEIPESSDIKIVIHKKQVNVEAKKCLNDNLKKKITYVKTTEDDPFISGIRNSDYDLLEELMDDDLRKEIGELSSDEESYSAQATNLIKPAKGSEKHVTVPYNKPVDILPQPAKPAVKAQTVKQNVCIQRPPIKCVYENKAVQGHSKPQTTPICTKITDTCSNTLSASNAQHNTQTHGYNNASTFVSNHMTNNSNLYVSAAPQPPAQNVVLIGSNIVYEGYSTVQTPIHTVTNTAYVVNSVPNMTLYQPTQYVQPVMSPVIIESTVPASLISTVQYSSISVEPNAVSDLINPALIHQNINNDIHASRPMNMPQQTSISYEEVAKKESRLSNIPASNIQQNSQLHPETATRLCLKEPTVISNNVMPKTHGTPVQPKISGLPEHIISESSELSYNREDSKYNNIIENIALDSQFKQDNMPDLELKTAIFSEHTENHVKQDSKISDILNKTIERKVLSEVQEKQILSPEKQVTSEITETKVKYQTNDYDKTIKTSQDQDRLKNKRMAIINRKISHYSEDTPIPLSYSPLSPAHNSEIETKSNVVDEDISSTKFEPQDAESGESIPQDIKDNCKENKSDAAPCRRILLRSSNKLQNKVTNDLPTPKKVTINTAQFEKEIGKTIIKNDEEKPVSPKRESKRIRNKVLNKKKSPEKQQKLLKVKLNVGRKAPLRIKHKKNLRPTPIVTETRPIEVVDPFDFEAQILGAKILKKPQPPADKTKNLPEQKNDISEAVCNESGKQEIVSAVTEMNTNEPLMLTDHSDNYKDEFGSNATEISKKNESDTIQSDKIDNSTTEHLKKEIIHEDVKEPEFAAGNLPKTVNQVQESDVIQLPRQDIRDDSITAIKLDPDAIDTRSHLLEKQENSKFNITETHQDDQNVKLKNEILHSEEIKTSEFKDIVSTVTEINTNEPLMLTDHSDNNYKEEFGSNATEISEKNESDTIQSDKIDNAITEHLKKEIIHEYVKEPEFAAGNLPKTVNQVQESDVIQLPRQDIRDDSITAIKLNPDAIDTRSHLLEKQETSKFNITGTHQDDQNVEIKNENLHSEEINTSEFKDVVSSDGHEKAEKIQDKTDFTDDTGVNSLKKPNTKKLSTDVFEIIHDNNLSMPSRMNIDDNDVQIIDETEKFKDTKLEDTKSNSDYIALADIPQSYKDTISIEHLPSRSSDNPLKKLVRITLPNGKVFKATVTGKVGVNFDTLFDQPSLKSVLINNLNSKAKYTFNVTQVHTVRDEKVLSTQIQEVCELPRPYIPRKKNLDQVIDTVNLVSDDEDESQQEFETEFGKYKIQTIDTDSYNKHREKLKLRPIIVIEKKEIRQSKEVVNNNPVVENAIDLICNETFEELKSGKAIEKIGFESLSNQAEAMESDNDDVVLIEDSSDDDISFKDIPDKGIDKLKENLLKDLGVGIIEPHAKDDTEVLKEKLLMDLGLNKETDSKEKDKLVRAEDSKVKDSVPLVSIEIPEIDLTEDSAPLEPRTSTNVKKANNCEIIDLTRQCYVKLFRFDALVKSTKNNQDKPIDQIVESKLDSPKLRLRSNSFSILDDFPLVCDINTTCTDLGRSSPVIEVFDFIASHESFVGQKSQASQPEILLCDDDEDDDPFLSVTCSADWFKTKQTDHVLINKLSTTVSLPLPIIDASNDNPVVELPSLTHLTLKCLQVTELIATLKPIRDMQVLKTLKRKSESSQTLGSPKISKPTLIASTNSAVLNVSYNTDPDLTDASITTVLSDESTVSIETSDKRAVSDLFNNCISYDVSLAQENNLSCKIQETDNTAVSAESIGHNVQQAQSLPVNPKHGPKVPNDMTKDAILESMSIIPEHVEYDDNIAETDHSEQKIENANAIVENDAYSMAELDVIQDSIKLEKIKDANGIDKTDSMPESKNPEQVDQVDNNIAESDAFQKSISNNSEQKIKDVIIDMAQEAILESTSCNPEQVVDYDDNITETDVIHESMSDAEQKIKNSYDMVENDAVQQAASNNPEERVEDDDDMVETDAIQVSPPNTPEQKIGCANDTVHNDLTHKSRNLEQVFKDDDNIAETDGIRDSTSNTPEQKIEHANDTVHNDSMQVSRNIEQFVEDEDNMAETDSIQESTPNTPEQKIDRANDTVHNDSTHKSRNLEQVVKDDDNIAETDGIRESTSNTPEQKIENANDTVHNDSIHKSRILEQVVKDDDNIAETDGIRESTSNTPEQKIENANDTVHNDSIHKSRNLEQVFKDDDNMAETDGIRESTSNTPEQKIEHANDTVHNDSIQVSRNTEQLVEDDDNMAETDAIQGSTPNTPEQKTDRANDTVHNGSIHKSRNLEQVVKDDDNIAETDGIRESTSTAPEQKIEHANDTVHNDSIQVSRNTEQFVEDDDDMAETDGIQGSTPNTPEQKIDRANDTFHNDSIQESRILEQVVKDDDNIAETDGIRESTSNTPEQKIENANDTVHNDSIHKSRILEQVVKDDDNIAETDGIRESTSNTPEQKIENANNTVHNDSIHKSRNLEQVFKDDDNMAGTDGIRESTPNTPEQKIEHANDTVHNDSIQVSRNTEQLVEDDDNMAETDAIQGSTPNTPEQQIEHANDTVHNDLIHESKYRKQIVEDDDNISETDDSQESISNTPEQKIKEANDTVDIDPDNMAETNVIQKSIPNDSEEKVDYAIDMIQDAMPKSEDPKIVVEYNDDLAKNAIEESISKNPEYETMDSNGFIEIITMQESIQDISEQITEDDNENHVILKSILDDEESEIMTENNIAGYNAMQISISNNQEPKTVIENEITDIEGINESISNKPERDTEDSNNIAAHDSGDCNDNTKNSIQKSMLSNHEEVVKEDNNITKFIVIQELKSNNPEDETKNQNRMDDSNAIQESIINNLEHNTKADQEAVSNDTNILQMDRNCESDSLKDEQKEKQLPSKTDINTGSYDSIGNYANAELIPNSNKQKEINVHDVGQQGVLSTGTKLNENIESGLSILSRAAEVHRLISESPKEIDITSTIPYMDDTTVCESSKLNEDVKFELGPKTTPALVPENVPDKVKDTIIVTSTAASDLTNKDFKIEKFKNENIKPEKISLKLPHDTKLTGKEGTEVILKGIQYDDPQVGTCFMFPLIEHNDKSHQSEVNLEIPNRDEIINLIRETTDEFTNERDVINDNFEIFVPTHTYSRQNENFGVQRHLKRKKSMSDVKIPEKRYRKGKNIDYPKFTTASMSATVYVKEYTRLMDYCSTVKFSYSRPFHKEHVEVNEMLTNWPIVKAEEKMNTDPEDIQENLFTEIEEVGSIVLDPLEQTLAQELTSEYNENDYRPNNIVETNFNMGFGERSDRVIQYTKKREINTLKLSAATLSDVKPYYQPYLTSEINSTEMKNIVPEQNEENVKLRHVKFMEIRDKVRTFFQKTAAELVNNTLNVAKNSEDNDNFPFGLTSTEFLTPMPQEVLINVVQVGQLPVSAGAQNPVTCDPRVTHVTNVSPSQCSAENSPGDDNQTQIKTEYTELTTADITLPLVQEYAHHLQQLSSSNCQEPSQTQDSDSNCISTEIKAQIKIELTEESSQERLDDEAYKQLTSASDNNNTNNGAYHYHEIPNSTTSDHVSHVQQSLHNAILEAMNGQNNNTNTTTDVINGHNFNHSTIESAMNGQNSNITIKEEINESCPNNIIFNNAMNGQHNKTAIEDTVTNQINENSPVSDTMNRLSQNNTTVEQQINDQRLNNTTAEITMNGTTMDSGMNGQNINSNIPEQVAINESFNNISTADNMLNGQRSNKTNAEDQKNLQSLNTTVEDAINNQNGNNTVVSETTNVQSIVQDPKHTSPFSEIHCNQQTDKTDQLAHAMSAAGITSDIINTSDADALVDIISQNAQSEVVTTSQMTTNNFTKSTPINAMALQQALAQILPQQLNQTTISDNGQPTPNGPPVLHIVQGSNAQTVMNKQNGAPLLHIVQNKSATNGVPTSQTNSFSGLSLVDTGLQQGGNQLLHIVNTGSQKNNNAGQLLKRVNLLTNIANVQGGNEQKMVQFLCKSADGKSIQLNAPHQRSMVLRLQPIDPSTIQTAPKSTEPVNQDASPSGNTLNNKDSSQQDIKSRSVYEENYAKFIQNGTDKPGQEKATSLPKFNQVFGKQVYQENKNDMNNDTMSEHTDGQQTDNNVHLDGINDINSPPLLLRKSPPQTSQAQANLVQQIKQTIAPMNIQTMHGGVIYTRQIPVNIGGGQTINLITVPSTELVDDSNQKQHTDGKFVHQDGDHVIKIVPQSQANNVSHEDNNSHVSGSNDTPQNPQPQPVLTQMRIKLPMLSKTPHMVSGARVVRPSFFQIQRNVIGGANQPVYQQLVLTTAPSLGQTIRVPAQTRPAKPPESQSSPESQMSSSTLEQLREFDMVLEQVKERSTVNPGSSHSTYSRRHSSADTTDSSAVQSKSVTETTQVMYTTENNQTIASYVNRKSTVTSASTSSFVRSPDSSGIVESPSSSTHSNMPHTSTSTSESTSSETPVQPKAKKKKKSSVTSSNPAIKMPPATPKPSSQKPLEDEQTTQRILYILAEYKEQVENSPDKDKPAPRRRNNLPPNLSKRKKSSSGSRRRDMSPIHGEDSCRTMGSEDSSCGTSLGECAECMESHSPQESPRKVVRKLTFEQETTQITTQTRTTTIPQRNVIVADGQTITVARGATGKPATTVLMPANYLLPVSMVKGGQQIAIVTNRGPKLLVGGGEGGTGGTLLFQRLIGPAGLKPVLTRPGVRHIRLPTAALHNLQAFNIATHATTTQPADSTASPASAPAPPDLVDTRAMSSPWPDREAQEAAKPDRDSSPEGSEPWNLPSSSIADDYGYEEIVRTDNMDRTVLDAIPDRYSPDMEAQRIFDKMFDVDSKKSMYDTRCGYDIDASDTDDRPYQVVQRRDGRHHRLTHVSAAALRHKYAILEHELRLQKSLSEECEDLGVDSPSAAELFPEAELFFAPSPVHEQTIGPCHTPQPTILNQGISQPDLDDQIATDHILTHQDQELDINLDDVGEMVTVGEDGMTTVPLDHEEFARSHPNTTFHTEPEEGEIPPFTISQSIKGRQITFHAGRSSGTVVMAPQTTVISQATVEASGTQNTVKFTDIDNMINAMPTPQQQANIPASVLVKDSGLTRFDNILTDSRELHLSNNTASAIVHSTGQGTQVIRRVRYDDRRDQRYMIDDPDTMMEEKIDDNRDMESMAGDDASSPERHPELFWESNSASERSEGRRRLDFSSDSDKCCKSPFDEASTDSSFGNHTRLDSVIKAARTDRSGSGSSDDHPPLRTYPPKRVHVHHHDAERSVSGKTRAGEICRDVESRRRASNRGVVKRGCHCCSGSPSPAPPKPKKSRQKKPSTDFTNP